MFCHSLVSDWNHGNAHFLRGVVAELQSRGHRTTVLEPADGWSRTNLVADYGPEAITRFHRVFPTLRSTTYTLGDLDLDRVLDGADLVLVHEWNDRSLVEAVGRHHAVVGGYRLFFHDTHHRSVTAPHEMGAYDLRHYDGVLAFGAVVRQRYLDMGWAERAWTWHEAADVRVFSPVQAEKEDDLVWIGNWGDEERTVELEEFLIAPAENLKLRTRVYGVRYPESAKQRLQHAGIGFGGWVPNDLVPAVFARHRVTVHVPRRPYAASLPGIPTIRVFEALACGIPLVSAPWHDAEGLFQGDEFLVARDGAEMRRHLEDLIADPAAAGAMAERGRATVLARHTCAHRVDELLAILSSLDAGSPQSLAGDRR
jgi:spore maturation protein CgeB